MKQNSVAVVGAAETTKMGKIPDVSVIGLHADAALNAMADAGRLTIRLDRVVDEREVAWVRVRVEAARLAAGVLSPRHRYEPGRGADGASTGPAIAGTARGPRTGKFPG